MLSRKHTAHANNCSVCVVGHDVVGLCFLLKLPCVLFSSCSPLSLFVAQEPDSNRKGSKMRRVLQWGLPIHVPFVRQSSSERTNERTDESIISSEDAPTTMYKQPAKKAPRFKK